MDPFEFLESNETKKAIISEIVYFCWEDVSPNSVSYLEN